MVLAVAHHRAASDGSTLGVRYLPPQICRLFMISSTTPRVGLKKQGFVRDFLGRHERCERKIWKYILDPNNYGRDPWVKGNTQGEPLARV